MKTKSLLLSFALMLGLSTEALYGQVKIDGKYLPARGSSFKQVWTTSTSGFPARPAAGPQTWDYSGVYGSVDVEYVLETQDMDSLVNYVNANLALADSFPDATHNWPQLVLAIADSTGLNYQLDTNNVSFWVDTSAFYATGLEGDFKFTAIIDTSITTPIPYSLQDTVMAEGSGYFFFQSDKEDKLIPQTLYYGKTWSSQAIAECETTADFATTDPVIGTFINGTYDIYVHRRVDRLDTILSWGTLTTPYGTFNETVMLKESYRVTDSINLLTPVPGLSIPEFNLDFDIYTWFYNNTFGTTYLMQLIYLADSALPEAAWYTEPYNIGNISGTVTDSADLPVTGGVVNLYRNCSNFTKDDILDTAILFEDGSYSFELIPYGSYYIGVSPDTNLFPHATKSYYQDHSKWMDADKMMLSTADTTDVDLQLNYLLYDTAGLATIIGQITQDWGYTTSPFKSVMATGEPVPGAEILLEQEPDEDPIGYAIADEQGNYEFKNVPGGEYKIIVDMPGLVYSQGSGGPISVDGEAQVGGQDYVVGKDSIYGTCSMYLSYSVTNESATGDDGAIDITVHNGKESFTANWSNSATTVDINGLEAGTYSLTLTDANGCRAVQKAQVYGPGQGCDLSYTVSVTDESATGAGDGAVDLSVSGGTTPYTYSWDSGATTEDLTGLNAGSYTATVSDQDGCELYPTATVGLTSVNDIPGLKSFKVYPVPVGNDFSVELSVDGTVSITIELVSIQGQSLELVAKEDLQPGTYTFPANSSAIAPGMFLIRISSGNKAISRPLIKQ